MDMLLTLYVIGIAVTFVYLVVTFRKYEKAMNDEAPVWSMMPPGMKAFFLVVMLLIVSVVWPYFVINWLITGKW